jgi:hypothetical protein
MHSSGALRYRASSFSKAFFFSARATDGWSLVTAPNGRLELGRCAANGRLERGPLQQTASAGAWISTANRMAHSDWIGPDVTSSEAVPLQRTRIASATARAS